MSQYNHLQVSFQKHCRIAIMLGAWIYLFLVIIGPFDASPISLEWRLKLMLPYSLFFMASYLAILPGQVWFYKEKKRWNYRLELLSLMAVYVLCFTPTYLYYKSNWVIGTYSLTEFILQM